MTFVSFEDALAYIKQHKGAEETPLIAFKGYEINVWEMRPDTLETIRLLNAGPAMLLALKAALVTLSADELYATNKETYKTIEAAINLAEGK